MTSRKRVTVPPGMRQVAAHAGVSVATVSKVLNQPDSVPELTRRRVNASIRRLGYVRNESARQLRAGRSRMVGLVVLDVSNPFFTDLARGVEDVASRNGLVVILCNSDNEERKQDRYLGLLEGHRVGGVLLSPVADAGTTLVRLRERGIPVVLIGGRAPTVAHCSVAVDDVLGGERAVSHLLTIGHKRVAYVAGPMTVRQVADRYNGALRALRRAGRPPADLLLIHADGLNVAAGRQAGAIIAAMPAAARPTGVFCTNDLMALGLLQEMTRNRIQVPEDVSIVGYDDIDFAAAAAVPLTSMRQPRYQLGHTAAQLLLEEAALGAEHQHREVIFEPDLVIRESTRLTAADATPDSRHSGLVDTS